MGVSCPVEEIIEFMSFDVLSSYRTPGEPGTPGRHDDDNWKVIT